MTEEEMVIAIGALNAWTAEVADVLNNIVHRIEHLQHRVEDLNARVNEWEVE